MLKESRKRSAIENCFIYFPYFNHKLYEKPSDINEEEEESIKTGAEFLTSEDSSTNTSHESIDLIENEEQLIPLNLLEMSPIKITFDTKEKNLQIPKRLFDSIDEKENTLEKDEEKKQIHPDLLKYKLPKSLFCTTKSKKDEEDEKNSLKNSSPTSSLIDAKLNIYTQPFIPKYNVYPIIICNNACYANNVNNKFGQIPLHFYNFQRINVDKKKKKKKQEFVEREGDWSCYRCKNINFSFREICNKCQFSKEESERKFKEVGEALLKLADSSVYNKKSSDNSN